MNVQAPFYSCHSTAIVGKKFRRLLTGEEESWSDPPRLASGVEIGAFSIIGCNSSIGANSIVDDYSKIECDVRIGSDCLVIYRAWICNEAVIGDGSVVGGFICERATLGKGCRVFGSLVHRQGDRSRGWDDELATNEGSPTLEDGAFVGFGAVVIGGVRVGRGACIAAGAIVTRDVDAGTTILGVNSKKTWWSWASRYFKLK